MRFSEIYSHYKTKWGIFPSLLLMHFTIVHQCTRTWGTCMRNPCSHQWFNQGCNSLPNMRWQKQTNWFIMPFHCIVRLTKVSKTQSLLKLTPLRSWLRTWSSPWGIRSRGQEIVSSAIARISSSTRPGNLSSRSFTCLRRSEWKSLFYNTGLDPFHERLESKPNPNRSF